VSGLTSGAARRVVPSAAGGSGHAAASSASSSGPSVIRMSSVGGEVEILWVVVLESML
jgi:hypothetical protein